MAETELDDPDHLDPRLAANPAEYVDLLRRYKDHSGLTFRQVQQRSRAHGNELPRSTLSTMLSRASLPREELVAALIRACGGGPDTVAKWVSARRRIASGGPTAEPASNPAPSRA